MNNKSSLALALAATLSGASTAADAATFNVGVLGVTRFVASGSPSAGNLAASTATFTYDDVTGVLTQTGGTFNVRFTLSPPTTLYRHLITGAIIGNGAAAAASTFVCQEGNFGGIAGTNLCGNYNFGANFIQESSVSYGPGTAFARTIGGDDMAVAAQQSILAYNGFTTSSWNGTTLVLSNATQCGTCASPNAGYQWTLSTVPVPPAVWLFGSALGVMGVMRRKLTG